MMKVDMYWISEVKNGRLTTMPKPDGGALLLPTLEAWKGEGVDLVVSLLADEEVETAVLQDEESLCQQLGLQFLRFPIQDFGVPSDSEAAIAFISKLSGRLSEGQNIAIHCWAGIGRSTTIAAGVLIHQGFESHTVFDIISQARGRPVPDTEVQKQWIRNLPH